MSKLSGLSLSAHLDSLFSIHDQVSVYGYPTRKIYYGYPGYDFSVNLFGKTAGTPMGPAAGPHTQLAHNILLSYLAGSRIIELKTIQILDQLEIPRPCIDMRNIGFNVEWSQELPLDESFQEYLYAWIMLNIIKEKKMFGKINVPHFYDFIFDTSVGYDLKGIQSENVQSWLNKMQNAENYITETIDNLPEKYDSLKNLTIPSVISDSVTLSTFHGCPPDEIEKIANHLIKENGFDVVIKLNPTLLGYKYVNELLINKLGYNQIQLDRSTFENDLSLSEAVQMIYRLKEVASTHNKRIGVKFTNTLVVNNSDTIFNEPVRYLSGTPLYVIAMHTMQQFREKAGWDLPVSFSGGIDKYNFADAISCSMIPVTACTDILKKGGYTRFTNYLENLKTEMDKFRVKSINDFLLSKVGINQKGSIEEINKTNTIHLIKKIDGDPYYLWKQNKSLPRTIQSELILFDCISCNICIPVCPNAANFSFSVNTGTEHYSDYQIKKGSFSPINEKKYIIEKKRQIGNIAEFCNDCGNCETFCPELGAPFKIKSRFYIKYKNFNSADTLNGFHLKSADTILAKTNGIRTELEYNSDKVQYIWKSDQMTLHFSEDNKLTSYDTYTSIKDEMTLDLKIYIISKIILKNYMIHRENFPNYI